MSAVDTAKTMTPEAIIAKIAEAGLLEFGIEKVPVAEKWQALEGPVRVTGGLNNADTNGALLEILKADTDKVLAGLEIAAMAVGVTEKVIVIPDYAEDVAKLLEGKDVNVEIGIVNIRENKTSPMHHFQTLAAIADIIDGTYEAGTYVAVCKDGKTETAKKVPFGTKVADIIGDVEMKAFAIGKKVYAPSAADMTIEADTQIENGVITVYGPECCMICEANKVLLADRVHSCGKCTFCREGIIQIHTMMDEITRGQGKKNYLDMMSEIGEAMIFSTQCTMGETASEFALGIMDMFPSDFEDHIKKKKCATGVCKAFMAIYIDPNTCTGCEECADVCPAEAIEGKSGFIHMIDEFECTKCGKCIEACEEEAIIQTTGRVPKLPNRLTKVGKFKKR